MNRPVEEPKILGDPKFLILGKQQYFCLGRRFSKHKMTRYAKNLATLMEWVRVQSLFEGTISSKVHLKLGLFR